MRDDEPGLPSAAVRSALAALGVDRLALAIHDASLPGRAGEDIGRGVPGSRAALDLARFARRMGFDALQLGPQGLTDEDDASPYMGALFSRNPLSISLARLAEPEEDWGELLPASRLEALAAARPAGSELRIPYALVLRAQRAALGEAFGRFERRRASGDRQALGLAERLQAFTSREAAWLESDALYEALRGEYGGCDWAFWKGPRADLDRRLGDAAERDAPLESRRAELARRFEPALRFYRFVQLLAHDEHARFRARTREIGLDLIGDLQVGVSPRDTWRHPQAFLEGYWLGAPPSRTNPEGQPWDYPVLDPGAYRSDGGADGPALDFLTARIEKAFAEYDAVRIDHPQGLVCPWVYRAAMPDPQHAVQQGARLFSSPDLPDHPELARHAIARREDLSTDPGIPRHHDRWVARLEAAQVDRYALLFQRVVEVASRHAPLQRALLCEVLSTLPYPLGRVLQHYEIGRFRVTQKADPGDPDDVYNPQNAEPRDWIMFGNHDTPPLWRLLGEWRRDGRLEARAAHAAARLAPQPAARDELRRQLLEEPGLYAHSEFAQLFASPARQISVFFVDLFGLVDIYNRPGTVGPDNWSLRLADDWRARYEARLLEDRALNLPLALWLALRARPEAAEPGLLRALAEEAEELRGGRPLRL